MQSWSTQITHVAKSHAGVIHTTPLDNMGDVAATLFLTLSGWGNVPTTDVSATF